ncbi:MAG: glycoside hydrolase family 43 protein [Treponema sp.]|jgi:GH43 family beta-xylosidase|nr:glycoside hydrolase family 43 protein [Treponema sp.]
MHLCEIQIRDPFIILDGGTYYLYGSTDKDIWKAPAVGFDVYKSVHGLKEFDGPFPAFRPPENFWSEKNFWAPEVYAYKDAYYMFATFKPKTGRRGTAVLKSETVAGPFTPYSDGPVTPPGWECLDGTLYVEGDGNPWMVFCHEWQQVGDGEICCMPMMDTLQKATDEPVLLFRASEAPWARELKGRAPGTYVTDGPFLYTTSTGDLTMLWSSFGEDGKYCIGLARSESGTIKGPWQQEHAPLYASDGGHGMVFRSFENTLYLAIHTPNTSPYERPVFLEIHESGAINTGILSLSGKIIS